MVGACFFLAHVSDRRLARDDAARCLAGGRCWAMDGHMVVDRSDSSCGDGVHSTGELSLTTGYVGQGGRTKLCASHHFSVHGCFRLSACGREMVASSPHSTHGSIAHRDGWSKAHSWLYGRCRFALHVDDEYVNGNDAASYCCISGGNGGGKGGRSER